MQKGRGDRKQLERVAKQAEERKRQACERDSKENGRDGGCPRSAAPSESAESKPAAAIECAACGSPKNKGWTQCACGLWFHPRDIISFRKHVTGPSCTTHKGRKPRTHPMECRCGKALSEGTAVAAAASPGPAASAPAKAAPAKVAPATAAPVRDCACARPRVR